MLGAQVGSGSWEGLAAIFAFVVVLLALWLSRMMNR